jgi:hypothetical protein
VIPIFLLDETSKHNPLLHGWFIKLLEKNGHYKVQDGQNGQKTVKFLVFMGVCVNEYNLVLTGNNE